MDIKYRIISVDEKDHSFVVRYYTDILTEDMLTSFFNDDGSIQRGADGKPVRCRSDWSLTVYNVNATHEEIESQIKSAAPAEWFRILEHANENDTTNAINNVKEKLDKEHNFTHEPFVSHQDKPELTDDEVAAMLKKLGI